MRGQHILKHQAKGIRSRVDQLSVAYNCSCILFFVIATISSFVLFYRGSVSTAVSLFILCTAITGYSYSALIKREQHITEITDTTISALRGRWDELRKDRDLLVILTSESTEKELEPVKKLKLRLYLSTILDMYAVIIHYINHGYFTHTEEFAEIYEGMIKTLFRYPNIIEIWETKDGWGKGCLRDEYQSILADIIEKVIKEIRAEHS